MSDEKKTRWKIIIDPEPHELAEEMNWEDLDPDGVVINHGLDFAISSRIEEECSTNPSFDMAEDHVVVAKDGDGDIRWFKIIINTSQTAIAYEMRGDQ